ncbi:MAG TPA: cytochrome c peroxidase [Polyangiaceae bacterium]|nr:cytochrome c peroxidase [Polyangiaceae bacterium]
MSANLQSEGEPAAGRVPAPFARGRWLAFVLIGASCLVALTLRTGKARPLPVAASSPRVAVNAGLTSLQLLGSKLFDEPALSEPPGKACSSCHEAERAFTGNAGSRIPAVAAGSRQEVFGNRNVPGIAYASFRPPFSFVSETDGDGPPHLEPQGGFFWDGRANSLSEQAKGPLLNPREMNNSSAASVVDKVRRSSSASLFRSLFGANAFDDVDSAFDRIAQALAAFESSSRFHPFSSKFDEVLRRRATFSALEARGFELFKNPEKGNCIACHSGNERSNDPADWLFTDFTFDALGLPRNPALPDNAAETAFDLGLCRQEGLARRAPVGVEVESLCGAFQVPTLRNVEVTAPYGHNGVFATLTDVVRFYVTRDTNPERWYPTRAGSPRQFDDLPPQYRGNVNRDEAPYDRKPGQAPRLNEQEIAAVVAFLRTLTDRPASAAR